MTDERPRGFGIAAGLDPDVAREAALRCDALGYASLWSNDHPGASGLETVAIFAAAARRPDVGVAVMALDRHQPADIAEKIGEVGIAPPRLWLGIGAGFTKRPLGVVREGIAALREVLPKNVRIVVAAMGPKMCALAGAEADGAFLNWMTPEKARWARERVHEGARDCGRIEPPPVFGYVRVAVGDDAAERLRKEEAFTGNCTRATSSTSRRSARRRERSASPCATRPRLRRDWTSTTASTTSWCARSRMRTQSHSARSPRQRRPESR